MVKIVNTLGDVKKGVQGETVYQGRYGQQIRRSLQPKRAIPSETQLQHRQLYRDALTWRKSLPLANRRFLDGYCIANWVVDQYHLPLPWHRFALKLYLEHVHFPLSDIQEGGEEGSEGTFESQEQYNVPQTIQKAYWSGQTITPLQAHRITAVELQIRRVGSPGTVYVDIFLADAEHKPTGASLCSGSADGNTFNPDFPGEWQEITLGDGALLSQGIEYVIQVKDPGGDSSNCLHWYYQSGTNPYPRGMLILTADSGSSWYTYPDNDFTFRDKSDSPSTYYKTAVLDIRHPALLTVVHKRGALTVRGYDNLSSLDEEYLTKQVGLDVAAGDLIEVTTVTGRHFTHQIH